MDNYIVRVYRRDYQDNIIAGIVEIVSTEEQRSFKSREELLLILKMIRPGENIVRDPKK